MHEVKQLSNDLFVARWRVATVTGTSGDKVTVEFIDDDGEAITQSWARLESYSMPDVGHQVLMVKVGSKGWVVLGRVLV